LAIIGVANSQNWPNSAFSSRDQTSRSGESQVDIQDRILDYLQENRTGTIRGLSQMWGLTRPDIRHHIQKLLKAGMIEQLPADRTIPTHRGRPEYVYRLISSSGDNNYQNLSAALLKTLLDPYEDPGKAAQLEILAQTLSGNPLQAGPLTQKLNHLVTWLNERGYHARWQASADGPRIMFFHCPYAGLLPHYPVLCHVDLLLLQQLSGLAVEQTARMALPANTSRACVFKLDG
jgi:predicted ArsR family transcriptional regulator